MVIVYRFKAVVLLAEWVFCFFCVSRSEYYCSL